MVGDAGGAPGGMSPGRQGRPDRRCGRRARWQCARAATPATRAARPLAERMGGNAGDAGDWPVGKAQGLQSWRRKGGAPGAMHKSGKAGELGGTLGGETQGRPDR